MYAEHHRKRKNREASERWRRRQGMEKRVAADSRAQARRYSDKLRRDVVEGYGARCACCGTTYFDHLTIDHIAGGGNVERRTSSNRTLHSRLRREGYPPGYQVLCWNCNWAKHRLGKCRCQG